MSARSKLFSPLTRWDLALAALILLLAAMAALGTWGAEREASTGAAVTVTQAGELVGSWPLDQDQTLEFTWQGHYNRLLIENGSARVTAANCPDKYCLQMGPVSRERETIICLPARLVVRVEGAQEGQLDAVSR